MAVEIDVGCAAGGMDEGELKWGAVEGRLDKRLVRWETETKGLEERVIRRSSFQDAVSIRHQACLLSEIRLQILPNEKFRFVSDNLVHGLLLYL